MNKKFLMICFSFLMSSSLCHYALGETVGTPPSKKKLAFVTKRSNLWYKHKKDLKEKDIPEIAQVFLEGEIYSKPNKIKEIDRKNVDRSTPEGLVASYISASKKGDINWIAENFVDEEKDKILNLFSDKKVLKESIEGANKIKAELIRGEAKYKGHLLLFIEQQYPKDLKATETIACRKTQDGWKITNSLSADETFDIVFAAVSTGQVQEVKQLTQIK
jgi:hypothetical protein